MFLISDPCLVSPAPEAVLPPPLLLLPQVVDLVIKQLNMAVILKGKDGPLYENEKLRNFCLVAVIGSRERSAPHFITAPFTWFPSEVSEGRLQAPEPAEPLEERQVVRENEARPAGGDRAYLKTHHHALAAAQATAE